MRIAKTACVIAVCLLCACASREALVPKSGAVPAGIDFSGTWRLRKDAASGQRRINEAIRRTDGVDDRIMLPPLDPRDERAARSRRNTGGLVHLFLEHGDTLKITQTPDGMFLSFDRSVVVEYRFGEYRQVRVGPVLAARVSGWEGDDYVAETLDENGMKLTERFTLVTDHTLQRSIVFRSRKNEQERIVQTFDRVG